MGHFCGENFQLVETYPSMCVNAYLCKRMCMRTKFENGPSPKSEQKTDYTKAVRQFVPDARKGNTYVQTSER